MKAKIGIADTFNNELIKEIFRQHIKNSLTEARITQIISQFKQLLEQYQDSKGLTKIYYWIKVNWEKISIHATYCPRCKVWMSIDNYDEYENCPACRKSFNTITYINVLSWILFFMIPQWGLSLLIELNLINPTPLSRPFANFINYYVARWCIQAILTEFLFRLIRRYIGSSMNRKQRHKFIFSATTFLTIISLLFNV